MKDMISVSLYLWSGKTEKASKQDETDPGSMVSA